MNYNTDCTSTLNMLAVVTACPNNRSVATICGVLQYNLSLTIIGFSPNFKQYRNYETVKMYEAELLFQATNIYSL